MKIFTTKDIPQIASALNGGEVGIIPTDTVYGMVGKVLDGDAIEKIYRLKSRPADSRFIIIASNHEALEILGLETSNKVLNFLSRIWPGPVSVELPTTEKTPEHISRGHNRVSIRIPDNAFLLELLKLTGPLVATSANKSKQPTVKNIREAKKVFGNSVDFYLDGGVLPSVASTLIGFKSDGKLEVYREGKLPGTKMKQIWDGTELYN
jgi:tRNA threonylcarbamoyl adenosine modification protein (Sua5/YciO/YrdC/YwlC family)